MVITFIALSMSYATLALLTSNHQCCTVFVEFPWSLQYIINFCHLSVKHTNIQLSTVFILLYNPIHKWRTKTYISDDITIYVIDINKYLHFSKIWVKLWGTDFKLNDPIYSLYCKALTLTDIPQNNVHLFQMLTLMNPILPLFSGKAQYFCCVWNTAVNFRCDQ